MRALLDTQLLIWAATDPDQLPDTARAIIEDGTNEIVFSIASIWEVAIKFGLRKPDFTIDPAVLRSALLANRFSELPILATHTFGVSTLPQIHRDPFDRVLVAQSAAESLALLTTDATLARYPGDIRRF